MNTGTCSICRKEDAPGGVACSPLGPISYFYCFDCLREGLEPWGMFLHAVGSDHLEDHERWFQELVERNLEFYGKTWEELVQESKKAVEEYQQHLKEEAGQEIT